MVEETARLVSLSNCGAHFDWEAKPFEHFQLFSIWRETERQIQQIQDTRLQWVLKSFFQQEEA